MNISTIKSILELVDKLLTVLNKKKILATTKMVIMLMIFYMCCSEFYLRNRYFQDAKRNNIIIDKIGNIVKECGKNSFVSWSTIEDNKISFSKKSLTFNDIVGCLGDNKNCPISVKLSNPAYLKNYYLSYDDYEHLNNKINNGMIVKCSIDNKEIICPDYTPNALKNIVKLTNLDLSQISYAVVKDWKRNLVYVFTLAFAKNSINTCSQTGGNMLLDNLVSTAMENL